MLKLIKTIRLALKQNVSKLGKSFVLLLGVFQVGYTSVNLVTDWLHLVYMALLVFIILIFLYEKISGKEIKELRKHYATKKIMKLSPAYKVDNILNDKDYFEKVFIKPVEDTAKAVFQNKKKGGIHMKLIGLVKANLFTLLGAVAITIVYLCGLVLIDAYNQDLVELFGVSKEAGYGIATTMYLFNLKAVFGRGIESKEQYDYFNELKNNFKEATSNYKINKKSISKALEIKNYADLFGQKITIDDVLKFLGVDLKDTKIKDVKPPQQPPPTRKENNNTINFR